MTDWYGFDKSRLIKGLENLPTPAATTLQAKGNKPLAEVSFTALGTLEFRTKARVTRPRGGFMGYRNLARVVPWKLGLCADSLGREHAEHSFDKKIDVMAGEIAGGFISTSGFFRDLEGIRKAGVELQSTEASYAGVPANEDPATRFGENLLLCLLAARSSDPDTYIQMIKRLEVACKAHRIIANFKRASSKAEANGSAGDAREPDALAPYMAQVKAITKALRTHDRFLGLRHIDTYDVNAAYGIEEVEEEAPLAQEAESGAQVAGAKASGHGVAHHKGLQKGVGKATSFEQKYKVGHIEDPQERALALKEAIQNELWEKSRELANKPPKLTEQEEKRALYRGRVAKASEAVIAGMRVSQTLNDHSEGNLPGYINMSFDKKVEQLEDLGHQLTDEDIDELYNIWAYKDASLGVSPSDPLTQRVEPIYPAVNGKLIGQIRDFDAGLKAGEIDPKEALQLYRALEKERQHWTETLASLENDLFTEDKLFETCLAMAKEKMKMYDAPVPEDSRKYNDSTVWAMAHGYKHLIAQNGLDDELIVRVRNETGYTSDDHVDPEYRKYVEDQNRSFANLAAVMLKIPDSVQGAAEFKAQATRDD